ncbi:MAG: hypothetical protein ABIG68_08600 [Acidobacteriota bacterium]
MTKKYRQPGYQDEGNREKRQRPPSKPSSRGSASRVETRFQGTTRCNNCAAEIQVAGQIEVTERCRSCGTDLHTCRNCLHFDPAARNECNQPVLARVANKGANNLCTHFEPKVLIEKKGSGAAAKTDSHRQAFLDLFKK